MTHLISIFEIPHILDSICGCLALHHLAVCVRVSKPWSTHFLPALYRSLHFSTEAELRHIAPKNFKLVQTIRTVTLSEPLWDDYETYSLPNIRELQLYWCLINYVNTERYIPKVISFLAIHPSLCCLDLSVSGHLARDVRGCGEGHCRASGFAIPPTNALLGNYAVASRLPIFVYYAS